MVNIAHLRIASLWQNEGRGSGEREVARKWDGKTWRSPCCATSEP